jgi:hypothetical protein
VYRASTLANSLILLEAILNGERSKGKYNVRIDQFKLFVKVRPTGIKFGLSWSSVLRRATFYGIGNIDPVLVQSDLLESTPE